MKSSIFIAGASAAVLAMATPIIHTEVDVVYEYDTVTVTGGSEPTQPPAPQPTQPAPKPVAQKNFYHAQKAPEPVIVTVTATQEQAQPTQAPPPKNEPEYEVVTVTAGGPSPSPEPEQPAPQPSVESTPEPEPTQEAPAPSYPNRPISANDLKSAAVNSHNLHRSNHSAPEAQWDERIAGYAANTAATCKYAHDMKQGSGDYGQNIAMWGVSSGAESLGDVGAINMAITDMWYNGELDLYLPSYYGEDSPDMQNFHAWGHFSQLVWKASTGVGCQAQFCPKGTMNPSMDAWFMVCNYYPAGNVGGSYGKNVMRPLGKASVSA